MKTSRLNLSLRGRDAVSTAARAMRVDTSGHVTELQNRVLTAAASIDGHLRTCQAHHASLPSWRVVVENAGLAVRQTSTGRGSTAAALGAVQALEQLNRDIANTARVLLEHAHSAAGNDATSSTHAGRIARVPARQQAGQAGAARDTRP
jgi:hypothetical protein